MLKKNVCWYRQNFLVTIFFNSDNSDLCWPLKIILLVSREGGRWKRQDTETADKFTEGGSAVSGGTSWNVYKVEITSIVSIICDTISEACSTERVCLSAPQNSLYLQQTNCGEHSQVLALLSMPLESLLNLLNCYI